VEPGDRGVGDADTVVAQAIRPARRERRQDGEPERPADLLGRVDETRREAGGRRGRAGHRDRHDPGEHEPGAHREQRDARRHVREVAPVDRHARQQGEPGGDREEPGQQRRAGAEAPLDPGEHDERHRADPHRDRQDAEARLRGRVAEDLLEVEGHEELEPEHRRDGERVHDVRARHDAIAQHPEREQRPPGRGLPQDEQRQQRGRDDPEGARIGVHDGDDREHDARHQQHRAERVGARAQPGTALDGQDPAAGQHRRDADRDVDEEDPAPVDEVGDDAPEEQPDRGARGADERVDPDRTGLQARIVEERDDHAECDRRGERTAGALQEARGDEPPGRLRDAAEHRGGDEEAQAAEQHASAAHEIADPPRQQQQAAERGQVGVDDPGQVGGREAEIALDARQGDGDDGLVDDRHERGRAQDDECEQPGAWDACLRRSGHDRTVADGFVLDDPVRIVQPARWALLRVRASMWNGAASGPATSPPSTDRKVSCSAGSTASRTSS